MQQQGQFLLFNRQEFWNWLFSTNFVRKIILLQVHHDYSPNYSCFNGKNYFDLLVSMQNYHKSIGYSDIAQNVQTFPDGLIAICRSFEMDPAGILGGNRNALCIENLGNFDVGGDIMTAEHKNYYNICLCSISH